MIKQILGRVLATCVATGLSVIGAGAIAGVEMWQAVLMAGLGGVAYVVEGLARAYLDDGKLTVAEIDAVFGSVNDKAGANVESLGDTSGEPTA
jgi:hypothetical protein